MSILTKVLGSTIGGLSKSLSDPGTTPVSVRREAPPPIQIYLTGPDGNKVAANGKQSVVWSLFTAGFPANTKKVVVHCNEITFKGVELVWEGFESRTSITPDNRGPSSDSGSGDVGAGNILNKGSEAMKGSATKDTLFQRASQIFQTFLNRL